jgi:hypothetical protein
VAELEADSRAATANGASGTLSKLGAASLQRLASRVAFTASTDAELMQMACEGNLGFFRRLQASTQAADLAAMLGQPADRASSVLHYAASHGHIALASFLLGLGVPPNLVNGGGATPLHYAVFKGNKEIAEMLLRQGAAPSLAMKARSALWYGSRTPLEFARAAAARAAALLATIEAAA